MERINESFKKIVSINILEVLKWRGTRMLFPYLWKGEKRYAVIETKDLLKIIKWDKIK